MSLKRFDECLQVVLKFEGGLSDHPDDPGGRTNMGITQREYDRYRKSLGLPLRDVSRITMDEVRDIYYRNYWTPTKAEKMPPPVDLVVFDTAVNCGVVTSIRFLRRVLTRLGYLPNWRDDVIRDEVPSLLWKLTNDNRVVKRICYDYLSERFNYYKRIVERNPRLKVFFKGWSNRLKKLKELVNKHFTEHKGG